MFDADNVECIAYDPHHHRLACSGHSGKVKLHRLERDGKPFVYHISPDLPTGVLNVAGNLVTLWTSDTGGSIPRTVIFGDKGQQLKVYCLESGEW